MTHRIRSTMLSTALVAASSACGAGGQNPSASSTELEATMAPAGPNGHRSDRLTSSQDALAVVEDWSTDYDLLILTPAAFESALAPLVSHKNDTAMPARLLTTELVTTAFSGADQPERIKRAIEHQHDRHGAVFIMLVGDSNAFPVRYVRAINTEWDTRYYPSDLYYADLYDSSGNFDDWDFNNDGFYGTTDFSGGNDTSKVNLDRIDLIPDVAVGRVPASSVEEVTRYVNKVVQYELLAWRSGWAERAVVTSDHGTSGPFSDATSAAAIVNSLTEYQVDKMYLGQAPYDTMSSAQRAQALASFLNDGRGYVSHMGHGGRTSWAGVFSATDMASLANAGTLPIAYSIGCHTANFHFGQIESQEQYQTTSGSSFDGRGLKKFHRPMPAALQPAGFDADSMAEHMLVLNDTGAVAYIGTADKTEHGAKALHRYFTNSLNNMSYNPKLGLMWMGAMRTFHANEAQPGMGHFFAYIHQHKVLLFGDPSLRVGGVAGIQKRHFLGEWHMAHDGWRGVLELTALADNPIESYYNIEGTYHGDGNYVRQVRAAVQTPNYLRGPAWHDNQIEIKVDFNNNLDFSDDQLITAYLWTQSKDEMAGVTHSSGTPFGVSISRPGKVVFDGFHDGISAQPAHLTGSYAMEHNGWVGTLDLSLVYGATIEALPPLQGEYLGADSKLYDAYAYHDAASPHIVTLFIDFANTVSEADDTRFDVHLFTQTKDGMAGTTEWSTRPFGARLRRLEALSILNLSGAQNQEHHYSVQVPAGLSSVTFEMSGGSGDADVYVRRGAKPTLSEWDHRPYTSGNNEQVTILNPGPDVYFVMVHGFEAFSGVELVSTR